jgi:hypothetical protein
MNPLRPSGVLLGLIAVFCAPVVQAWDYEGHRIVNQLALDALPADFPAFVREPAASARVLHAANIPDRWRNVDPFLRQSGGSWTDHFCDLEQLPDAGLDPRTVPSYRLDFALVFAAGRIAHAEKFPAIDPAKNSGHTNEWPGFAPWAIAENFHRLRSAFGYLKAYLEVGGSPEEIANAQADVVFYMGLLGHSVGDGAQPLHTTNHHNGWVGANPAGYTTWKGFHSWCDGGLVAKAGLRAAQLKERVTPAVALPLPARADGRDPAFVLVMDYLLAQHTKVEPLYRLELEGKLGNKPGAGPVSDEGRDFFAAQLVAGGQMLANLWVTAWKSAPLDTFLREQLVRRQTVTAPASVPQVKP